MINDYISNSDRLFFKHETTERPECNTYSMHTHNTYELIYFISGDATHVIEDRKYKLSPGDLILIRPFQYHFIQIDSPHAYERYDILFDPKRDSIESASLVAENVEVINLGANRLVEDIFAKCDLYRNAGGEAFERILPHLLSELFYNIWLFPHPPAKNASKASPLISKVLRYINDNIGTVGSIADIAEHFFVSESYLFRLFKRELYQTPKKYIMEKRLLLSQKMLLSGTSATDVCVNCGFGDYTTFYRNYTAFFGHSPKGV